MFLTTVYLVIYHLVAWLPRLAFSPFLKSTFEELLTLKASEVLLLMDAAPEADPVPTPATDPAVTIYSAFYNRWNDILFFHLCGLDYIGGSCDCGNKQTTSSSSLLLLLFSFFSLTNVQRSATAFVLSIQLLEFYTALFFFFFFCTLLFLFLFRLQG